MKYLIMLYLLFSFPSFSKIKLAEPDETWEGGDGIHITNEHMEKSNSFMERSDQEKPRTKLEYKYPHNTKNPKKFNSWTKIKEKVSENLSAINDISLRSTVMHIKYQLQSAQFTGYDLVSDLNKSGLNLQPSISLLRLTSQNGTVSEVILESL